VFESSRRRLAAMGPLEVEASAGELDSPPADPEASSA